MIHNNLQLKPIALGIRQQYGVSLIEMMVGLTVGIFVVAGAASIFLANSQSNLVKDKSDRAQENFRFATNTLTRVVRQASGFGNTAGDNGRLIVNLPVDATSHDCLGAKVATAGTNNTFSVNGDSQLVCVDLTGVERVLSDQIKGINFAYGVDADGDKIIQNDEYIDAASVTNWNLPTSTRITLSQTNDETVSFVVALRQKVMATITAPPAPTPAPPAPTPAPPPAPTPAPPPSDPPPPASTPAPPAPTPAPPAPTPAPPAPTPAPPPPASDTSPPIVTVAGNYAGSTSSKPAKVKKDKKFFISFSASDETSEIVSASIGISATDDAELAGNVKLSNKVWTQEFEAPKKADEKFKVIITVKDKSGNTTTITLYFITE